MLKDAQRSTDAFNVFMFAPLFIGLFGIGAKIEMIYIPPRENQRLLSFPCSSNLQSKLRSNIQLYFLTQRMGQSYVTMLVFSIFVLILHLRHGLAPGIYSLEKLEPHEENDCVF